MVGRRNMGSVRMDRAWPRGWRSMKRRWQCFAIVAAVAVVSGALAYVSYRTTHWEWIGLVLEGQWRLHVVDEQGTPIVGARVAVTSYGKPVTEHPFASAVCRTEESRSGPDGVLPVSLRERLG